MKALAVSALTACSLMLLTGCDDVSSVPELPVKLAGDATTNISNRWAYIAAHPGLTNEIRKEKLLSMGRSLFAKPWVSAPSTTFDRDGLGPLFNSNSCAACHAQGGQGHAPMSDGDFAGSGVLLRLSVPTDDTSELIDGSVPSPHYGGQLQERNVVGYQGEGTIRVRFTPHTFTFPDGETETLWSPHWQVGDGNYGDTENLQISARIGPRLVGMGLLDAIPDSQLELWAKEQADAQQGISGKVARVYNRREGQWDAGRFGWKAEAPSLEQQVAAAFQGDMGLTSVLYPEDNCSEQQQPECRRFPNGGQPEVDDRALHAVADHLRYKAVPAVRHSESEDVQAGWALFNQLGCIECHKSHVTVLSGDPLINVGEIHPFSDLLLHDMGEALSDHRPVFNAEGSEWRTPPLWGIGLAEAHLGSKPGFLHDGRARNIQQAILWHGGEAEKSMTGYISLEGKQRSQLLEFLNAL